MVAAEGTADCAGHSSHRIRPDLLVSLPQAFLEETAVTLPSLGDS